MPQTFDRAVAAYTQGRFAEAEQICEQILAVQRNFFDALHLLAVVQAKLGKIDKALQNYDSALTLQPRNADVLSNRGAALHEARRFDEALASYDRALAVQANNAAVLFNRGNALNELKRFDHAIASYDRALALHPGHLKALFNRGNALKALGHLDEALTSYDRALALRADYVEALNNRGLVLHELKRFDAALASFGQALTARPDHAEAHYNRANTLADLNRFEEALADFDRAIALRPDYARALLNRGITLQELNRFDEALASFDRAIALQPDGAEAHYNQALCQLLTGDFARGFANYEWRWQATHLRDMKRDFAQPLWLGEENIAGRTILLHAEQGFGDTIQFCRYVPLLAARGARVVFEVQEPLLALMRTLQGATQLMAEGAALPEFDMHCPLLSLPLAFHTRLETVPRVTPYLAASAEAIKTWDARLGPRRRPRIGLVWSGRPAHKNDHNRSIPLAALSPLFEVDATFVSLQKEVRATDATLLAERGEILHFGDALNDFADTAALISNLDLVITVDTSIAHLAGALGKPVWVLVPFMPDWRWLIGRHDSPWYSSARLFRQDGRREWASAIARVRAALPGVTRL